ncbi:MAG: dihydroneopterin aldolase [Chitinophagaceae bacterium]|nr:dihydroneopterin aldolase [Chitinophagaceae bacterium]
MAVIAFEGMKFHAHVGYYEAEQLLGNEIEVSIKMAVNFTGGSTGDELTRTVDYEEVYETVRKVMLEPMHLLETAVQKIISGISNIYPSVYSLKVRVAKLNPPLHGRVKKVWVEDNWVRNIHK